MRYLQSSGFPCRFAKAKPQEIVEHLSAAEAEDLHRMQAPCDS